MEATATHRYLRMAPRKVRVVLDAIRGEPVESALARLRFGERRACAAVLKVLSSAVANAHEKFDVGPDELFVKAAWADQGPTLKRFSPRAMGRATRINKKTSHVTVVVGGLGEE
jgi:large subunit ribosomal protein L22